MYVLSNSQVNIMKHVKPWIAKRDDDFSQPPSQYHFYNGEI